MQDLKIEGNAASQPHVGLQDKEREDIGNLVAQTLADTYNLYWTTHNYHFNVVGPHFSQLHALFEEQYNGLWAAFDELAERVRSLGMQVPLSPKDLARQASWQLPEAIPDWRGMLDALAEGHEAVARTIRKNLTFAEAANDATTVDLLTQRLAVHEKTGWMLRSHLG